MIDIKGCPESLRNNVYEAFTSWTPLNLMKKIVFGVLSVQIVAVLLFNLGSVKKSNTLLFLNVWYRSGQDSLIQVLKPLNLDILAFSEISNQRLYDLAQELNYEFVEPFMESSMDSFRITHRGIMSKYPITILNSFAAQLSLPESEIIVYVVHLNSQPYLPYDVKDGKYKNTFQVEQVAKETKGLEISQHMKSLDTLKNMDLPIFLVGDFNEPSYLDWINDNKDLHQGMVIKWPTHLTVEKADFIDAYREVFPDPILKPGNTWSPLFPETPQDRIDFIYYYGNIDINDIGLIGRYDSLADVYFPYYPSDHRGIFTSFTVAIDEK